MRISPTKSTFFLGKNFGDTRHPYEKNEPTLDHSGGGLHGKACWLIAYLCFKATTIKFKIPTLHIGQINIPNVTDCRYLGITISVKICENVTLTLIICY